MPASSARTCEALTDSGHAGEIVILDDLSTGNENIQHLLGDDRVSFVAGSVTDAELSTS